MVAYQTVNLFVLTPAIDFILPYVTFRNSRWSSVLYDVVCCMLYVVPFRMQNPRAYGVFLSATPGSYLNLAWEKERRQPLPEP